MAKKTQEIKVRIRYYKEDGSLGDYDALTPEEQKKIRQQFTRHLADAIMKQKGYKRVEKEDNPPEVYEKYFGNTGTG